MGQLPCDDSNVVNFDGCSETCNVEAGFKCGGGTFKARDWCAEIWNDGLDYGQYECDQGNFNNADGCDQFG